MAPSTQCIIDTHIVNKYNICVSNKYMPYHASELVSHVPQSPQAPRSQMTQAPEAMMPPVPQTYVPLVPQAPVTQVPQAPAVMVPQVNEHVHGVTPCLFVVPKQGDGYEAASDSGDDTERQNNWKKRGGGCERRLPLRPQLTAERKCMMHFSFIKVAPQAHKG